MNRRQLLQRAANGFGGLALSGLLAEQQRAAERVAPTVGNTLQPRAKSVIFLFMEGGPSQVDTFDPKPRLSRDDGQPLGGDAPVRLAHEKLLKSPFKFGRYGESGRDVSELFPHLAKCVDHLAIVRSMHAEHSDHGSANYFLHTGTPFRGRPSVGSWVTYGLGSENENLPSYIVLNDGVQLTGGGEILSQGFLPAKYAPTLLRGGAEPLPNLQPRDATPALQRRKIAAIRELDQLALAAQGGNPQLESVIANFELAFRMQSTVLEAVDQEDESAATRKLYGLDEPETEAFGRQCLRARRLVERGVRFVQVISPDHPDVTRWDQHTNLIAGHRLNARRVDRPIAGLLHDLDSRGLLTETIVLWGGEFGRTPTAQSVFAGEKVGRDHNPHGYTMWLAGGGVRPGIVHGATDEHGFRAIDKPVSVYDLHATVLHLLGIDHTQLTFRQGGRDYRLTDVYGEVVHELLA
jgi:hypothetical protein